MVLIEEELPSFPDSIGVIGGGRWARVLTGVLCSIVPSSARIAIYSPRGEDAMSGWASTQVSGQRIQVSSQWSEFVKQAPAAAIIVNAARDHESAIELALSAGIPVLVEKPIAPTLAACKRVVSSALSRRVPLAAAQVFLFARYVEHFSRLVATAGIIRSVRMQWMDPQAEDRYGEAKTYDAGLPVFADWLPHVLPILGTLRPGVRARCDGLQLSRGGAHVELQLSLGNTSCSVRLVRNGERRERLIEVTTDRKAVQLDFSKEPGFITADSTTIVGDPEWETKQRPVARMLTAFLQSAARGNYDPRLSAETGLDACRLIEEARRFYDAAQFPCLAASLDPGADQDPGHRYALAEILQYDGPMSQNAIDECIERLRKRRSLRSGDDWLKELAQARDPGRLLRAVAVT